MKFALIPIILTLLVSLVFQNCTDPAKEQLEIDGSIQKNEKLLRHVVLFKFKETVTQADLKQIEENFASLPAKIEQIRDFEWGINNSPEGLDKGFTHCFLITFETEGDRSIYLPHPDHQAFVEIAGPHTEDVLVIDYWVED